MLPQAHLNTPMRGEMWQMRVGSVIRVDVPEASGVSHAKQSTQTDRVVVMSLLTSHAEAVLAGDKSVEIRTKRVALDVSRVALYAAAPTRMIVGECVITERFTGTMGEIWERYRHDLWGMSPRDFVHRSAHADRITALVMGHPIRYKHALPLSMLSGGIRTPRGFYYRPARELDEALWCACVAAINPNSCAEDAMSDAVRRWQCAACARACALADMPAANA